MSLEERNTSWRTVLGLIRSPYWLVMLLLLVVASCAESEAPAESEQTPFTGEETAASAAIEPDAAAAEEEAATRATALNLQSTAFTADGAIPTQYTCDGVDISPPLSWSDPPPEVESFALIMDDPDAEPVAGFVWDHWLLFNIPASASSLPEDVPADSELADGSRHGETSFGSLGYGGPCPPGGTHEYRFRLYALDTTLELAPGVDKDALLEAMDGHILAQAELTATYTRQ